jgi:single-strand DNA-binding protein
VIGYNRVIVIGSLTRDPEIRYNPRGKRVAIFTVAIPDARDPKGTADHFDAVVILGKRDDPMEKIHKGSWVLIEGKMKQRKWETPQGQPQTKVEIIADSIEHLRT